MRIIKLDATDSTNAYLKNVMLSEVLDDFTIVTAREQLKGRGQMGTEWQSEPGKNLTFSLLKKFDALPVREQFLLNIAVSLAVYNTLKNLQITDVSIKWPNDILSGSLKICGILIENVLHNQHIQSAVIGIGLNVNQVAFDQLPDATSIKLVTGKTLVIDEILQALVKQLKRVFLEFEGKTVGEVKTDYEKFLFRKDKPSTFRQPSGELFMGFIRGVNDQGRLRVVLEDGVSREFDFKELQLLY
ncbi:MAG TPA: biotin--[acetyl-CoA-carboxylase] ligase [Eudoraea sp.]|nr:biotin--[acetyl-CoA-carboxylase] ligase [Eudoraea sp.]